MQEAEEQDTCRICSAPAEPDQPLFHPCKCSGTIRYIHQDCLTTWLAHSKKKTCDLCKHQYAFTKVYASDMPSKLPPILMAKRLVQQIFTLILLGLRAIAVTFVWLALVPLITVWSWRMYFSMGETTAWWISNRPRPPSQSAGPDEVNPLNHPFLFHLLQYYPASPNTSTNQYSVDTIQANSTMNAVLDRTINHPTWIALSADIFAGQVIASLIVITFVAIFLLREWIAQNARPGVFDDNDDVPANVPQEVLQVPPAPAPLPAEPENDANGQRENGRGAANRQMMDVNARLALARQQLEAMRALEDLRAYDRDTRERQRERRERREQGTEDEEPIPRAVRNGRSALEFAPARDEARNEELDRFAVMRVKTRRGKEKAAENELFEDEEDEALKRERRRRRNFARRLEQAKSHGARRRVDNGGIPAIQLPDPGEGSAGAGPDAVSSATASTSGGDAGSSQPTPSTSAFFPNVTLQRPTSAIPFSLAPSPSASASSSTSNPSTPASNTGTNDSVTSSVAQESSPLVEEIPIPILTPIRRPPLPTTTLPVSTSPTATYSGPSTPMSNTRTKTPLASPSLATYRPPEELGDLHEGGYFAVGPVPVVDASSDEEFDLVDVAEGREEDVAKDGNEEQAAEVEDDDETLEDEEDAVMREQEMDQYFADPDQEQDAGSETEEEEEEVEEVEEDAEEARLMDDIPHDEIDEDEDEDDEEEDEDEDFEDLEEEGDAIGHGQVRRVRDRRLQRARDRARAAAQRAGGVAPNVQAPVAGPLAAEAGQDEELLGLAEDLEGGVEDDMEGAMEAIGMRGPILGILQNAALMILVLDTAIGLGIWIPFTIGKCTALLSLDPYRALQILHLPIRAIRLLTDPIVDSVLYIITDLLAPPYIRIAKKLVEWCMRLSFFLIASVLGQGTAAKAKDSCQATYSLVVDLSQKPMEILGLVPAASEPPPPVVSSAVEPSILTRVFSVALDAVEPYFAPVGKEVREGLVKFEDGWTQLALGHGPAERAFSVFLGYSMVAIAIALYLNILTVGNVKTAGKAVRSAVRQQLLVLKVATFIFIELIVFPLGCGIVLDICTVRLFPDASWASRMVFFHQAPLTALFYHWVAGTIFMYSFAVLLSGCRKVMRPGAMWFIKDPQDQNSHPIREILDRPTLVQIRKICVSALMYSFVVACSVGSIAGLLAIGTKSILPFRWKTREPLSAIPVDLIFLHLALPYTISYFRPRKSLKKFATILWKALARRLRLSSYFFGGRHSGEEYTPKKWTLKRVLNLGAGCPEDAPVNPGDYDGTFRRVPNTDHIALPRDMRATVEVDVYGAPVDDAARTLMTQQDAEAQKAKRNVKDDYLTVYIPPYFRYRIFAFIILLWGCGAVCLGLTVAAPIAIGRGFFNLFLRREVHDGYSMIAGFYLLWGCWIVGKAVDKLDKRRQRRGAEGPRAALWWLVVKRGLLWLVKASFMAFFLGVVVPTLIGVAVELYFVLPAKLALKKSRGALETDMGIPKLKIVDCWALGLLYMKIAMKAARIPQINPFWRGVHHIRHNGWIHPDPVQATKEVIAPLTVGLLGMILVPGSCFVALRVMFPAISDWATNTVIFTHVYPGIFCLASFSHLFLLSGDLMASWTQSVRDKEFLVEMRLKNHEPESARNRSRSKGKGKEKNLVESETQTLADSAETEVIEEDDLSPQQEMRPDLPSPGLFDDAETEVVEEDDLSPQQEMRPDLPSPGLFDDAETEVVEEEDDTSPQQELQLDIPSPRLFDEAEANKHPASQTLSEIEPRDAGQDQTSTNSEMSQESEGRPLSGDT